MIASFSCAFLLFVCLFAFLPCNVILLVSNRKIVFGLPLWMLLNSQHLFSPECTLELDNPLTLFSKDTSVTVVLVITFAPRPHVGVECSRAKMWKTGKFDWSDIHHLQYGHPTRQGSKVTDPLCTYTGHVSINVFVVCPNYFGLNSITCLNYNYL